MQDHKKQSQMIFKNSIPDKFYRLFFLAILSISIVLRFPHLFVERLWPDEALYAWNAKRIFLHPELMFSKEIVDFHPPLFSALLSVMHLFFPAQLACHSMVFLLNILGVVAIYFLGKKIQGRFLGCFSAMMLSFNVLYFFMSGYLLIDGVLTAFMIVFFYILTSVSRKTIAAEDFLVGLAGAVLILLKWSGCLILPLIGVYYVFALRELTVRERLIKALVPLGLCSVLVVSLLAHNYHLFGSWFPKVFGVPDVSYQQPFFFYCGQLVWYVISKPVVPFFIFGLWVALRSHDRDLWVHGFWVVFALFAISAMQQKDVRFMMPIFPSIILIMGIACEFLLSKLEKATAVSIFKPVFLILVFGFFLTYYYPKIERFMMKKSYAYVGYRGAADYVKEQMMLAPDTQILTGSARIMRYYTDINFSEFGGNISLVPQDEVAFKDKVSAINSPIIVVVDRWEWAQPKWIYPLTVETTDVLENQGFKLERLIKENILVGKDQFDKKDVIWCFRREAIKPF